MSPWDTQFPPLLRQLHELEFDYADGDGIDFEPFSALYPASENADWFRAWTGNPAVDGAQFRIFGQDGSGGYAAFWLKREGAALLDQPIVFLGSEGEKGVVADHFDDYLWLLAGGIGPFEAVAYPGITRAPDPAFTAFARQHARTAAKTPEQVLAAAAAAHPEFAQSIDDLCR